MQDCKNYLEASQIERKNCYLRKKKIDVDGFIKDLKEFVENNKLILKTQLRFKNERHNVLTEEINKIALSSNDDKRIQSIISIKTYGYKTSKDRICKKEKIKRNDIIKQYRNVQLNL